MKTIFFAFLMICSISSYAQYGGFGFVEITYATIGERFIDETSDGFTNPELQLNESGLSFGASGKFMFNAFTVGAGGGFAFLNSDNDFVKMNVGHGYGSFGYNIVMGEDLIVNASGRLGGFGNSLSVKAAEDNGFVFGDRILDDASSFMSGSFMYGAEVDVIYFITQVPGLVVGISGYFTAPINLLTWRDGSGTDVMDVEQGEYTHFGISLKIGGGGFTY